VKVFEKHQFKNYQKFLYCDCGKGKVMFESSFGLSCGCTSRHRKGYLVKPGWIVIWEVEEL